MTTESVARKQKKLTLYEQSFTPCPEHTPDVDIDSGELCPNGHSTERIYPCRCLRVTWRTFLAHSPTVKGCADCQQATHETARVYAIGQAHKRQPISFRPTDLRWWYQRTAERASYGQWGMRLIDWRRAVADWGLA